jgi:hypothetical protein
MAVDIWTNQRSEKKMRNEKTWCEKEHVLRDGFDEIEVNGGSMHVVDRKFILYGYLSACPVRPLSHRQ